MNTQIMEFEQVLQTEGYRLTASRRVVVEMLIDSGGHVSADDLYDRIAITAPTVGRMTVYRTLDLLCQLGLIRPIYQGTGAAHYILLDEGHHHHLVCSICHQTIEFEDCVIDEITRILSQRFDFEVQGHLLEVYGRCLTCQTNSSDRL